jgi:hypothetical protein
LQGRAFDATSGRPDLNGHGGCMKVTLSNGKTFEILPLNLEQLEEISELEDKGTALAYSVLAVWRSMQNAEAELTIQTVKRSLTMTDLVELSQQVREISGLNSGEAKATA